MSQSNNINDYLKDLKDSNPEIKTLMDSISTLIKEKKGDKDFKDKISKELTPLRKSLGENGQVVDIIIKQLF